MAVPKTQLKKKGVPRKSPAAAKPRAQRAKKATAPAKTARKAQQGAKARRTAKGAVPTAKPLTRAARLRKLLEVTSPALGTPAPTGAIGPITLTADADDLDAILDEEVQLVMWRRPGVLGAVTALADPALTFKALPHFLGLVDPAKATATVRDALLAQPARALNDAQIGELAADIGDLTQRFAALATPGMIRVRLERLRDNGCAFWHADSVPFRLVTTYRGPCTEYVEPAFGQATLKRRKVDSKHAKSMTHHDVALFKGRGPSKVGDPLLGHPGIVHRSPRIEGSGVSRVVLVLDFPQDDDGTFECDVDDCAECDAPM
jgi:hypothetical protein